jgi:murein DD-endopeptidase MepM/ murein hydrolase activator NlpD
MGSSSMQPEIKIIPNTLLANRLQNGWREFFCYLSFPINQAMPINTLSWNFSLPKKQAEVVGGNHLVTKQELETRRVVMAALLPPEWDEGEMIVEVSLSRHNYVYRWAVGTYHQSNSFRLPLEGQVLILGGHRIGEVHRSAWQIASQQMGWDMIPLHPDGLRILHGTLSQNLRAVDFAAYGCNVLAPAAGQVIKALDGNLDSVKANEPPKVTNYYLEDLTRACGNYVIIDHGQGVWSCLAHLRNGSVKVKPGDAINAGQIIGELGNSGFSSGPHLHLHFMDSPDLLTASPLPVELDLEGVTYAPQSGEIVSS